MGETARIEDDLVPPDNPSESLCWRAQCALNWSHLEEARSLGQQAFAQLSADGCDRSDSVHALHHLLGRVDLKSDDVAAAKEHLSASAHVERTPILSSFGPSMALAHALLVLGERDAVLKYLDACRLFWQPGTSLLDGWSRQVREGEIPDFGFHLRNSPFHGPACWEVRRSVEPLGRAYLETREGAWFVCSFERAANVADLPDPLHYNFREVPADTSELEDAYQRLQELQLTLHPGDGEQPVTDAVIQIEGDSACFRY